MPVLVGLLDVLHNCFFHTAVGASVTSSLRGKLQLFLEIKCRSVSSSSSEVASSSAASTACLPALVSSSRSIGHLVSVGAYRRRLILSILLLSCQHRGLL